MNWPFIIILCLVLSLPYGIGHWLVLQERKKDTLIPVGSWTSKYGFLVSLLLKGFSYLLIIWISFKYSWYFILVTPVIWIISGFLARRIERIIYGKDLLDMFEYHAERYLEKFGEKKAPKLWEKVVPKWWIRMMSSKWKEEYKKRVGKYIKSTDTTNLLFDRDKFD